VTQEIVLTPDRLTLTMTVAAGERAMPVVAGWPPCFSPTLARGGPAALEIDAASVWERDVAGIPTPSTVTRGCWRPARTCTWASRSGGPAPPDHHRSAGRAAAPGRGSPGPLTSDRGWR